MRIMVCLYVCLCVCVAAEVCSYNVFVQFTPAPAVYVGLAVVVTACVSVCRRFRLHRFYLRIVPNLNVHTLEHIIYSHTDTFNPLLSAYLRTYRRANAADVAHFV